MKFRWMYFYAQLRRIAPRRAPEFRAEIEKAYREAEDSLLRFLIENYDAGAANTGRVVSDVFSRARLLDEFVRRWEGLNAVKADRITWLVSEAYEKGFDLLVKGTKKGDVAGMRVLTPQSTRQATINRIEKLTLNKRLEGQRAEIMRVARREIAAGMDNGDSYRQMARRIEGVLEKDFAKALRIARTETHRNSEAGKWEAAMERDAQYVAEGIPLRMQKTWKTAGDERVRPEPGKKGYADHREMRGKALWVEELFELRGSKGGTVTTQYPGATGDAGNDINCRCRCSYRPVAAPERERAA